MRNGKDKIANMNNMEIKQGDKVRVSKDAPRMYISGHCRFFYGVESVVEEIEDGNAIIRRDDGSVNKALAIPCKYLVKVDAEAKKAKFKVGDKVKIVGGNPDFIGKVVEIEAVCSDGTVVVYLSNVGHSTYKKEHLELYTEPTAPTIKPGDRVRNIESGVIGVVDMIVYGNVVWVNGVDGKRYHWKSDGLELIEPTEQTEAEKKSYEGISEETANEISNMLEAYAKALSGIADSFDWQRYEADLAKEVALKVANKFNDPKEAAEYAVSVAKSVVEGLKRK